MDVSDVLRDRLIEPPGLERMTVVSVLVHIVVLGGLFLLPSGWFSPATPAPKTIMTISLNGGNGGPNNGGFSSISQRAVQTEAPPPPRPEPVRPPAAVTPAETVPVPTKAPPRAVAARAQPKPAAPAPKVEQAPEDAKARTPTKGFERREGNAFAETGARGQGFGLSTSGGMGTGSTLDIVGEFCCPEYLTLMVERIRTNWNARAEVAGVVIIKYTIQRDGRIVDASIEQPSPYSALNLNALRAVVGTQQLPPLPGPFNNPTLTVHLNFQYTR